MCMYLFFKSVNELNSKSVLEKFSLQELKKKIEILAIDDDGFSYLELLNNHGFHITYKKDITDLKEVEPYDCILCDIRGVGKFLGSQYDGAYLVQQIRKNYPSKIIIAYTAESLAANYQSFMSYADDIIEKGAEIERWTASLDKYFMEAVDPIRQWKKVRTALLAANVPSIEVAILESKYVKAIQKGTFRSYAELNKNRNNHIGQVLGKIAITILEKIFLGEIS